MQYPFAMLTKSDWNRGEDVVNMYLGDGGEFLKPGPAEDSVNNSLGVAPFEMLRAFVQ